jgi:hypothetical protein
MLFCGSACSLGLLADDGFYQEEDLLVSDDLLLEDEFELDAEGINENADNVRELSSLELLSDVLRLSLSRQFAYADELEQSSLGARFELDSPLWEGAYVRLDYQVSHYFSSDNLAESYGEPYTHRDLKEAWLQLSYEECVAKLGRQTLFWGRVEGAYALDSISPIDFTKPLITDFSDIRLASEMALIRCYSGDISTELFYQDGAQLNRLTHHDSAIEKSVSANLGDEWGGRLTITREGYDLSLSFARLYTNQFFVLLDETNNPSLPYSAKYDLYGASLGYASGSVMYELDVGYRTKQVASIYQMDGRPADTESALDVAIGFEYLTSSNHQINGGVWSFSSLDQQANQVIDSQAWNLTWAKSYLNDLLDLSALAAWFSESDTAGINFSSAYEVSDQVQVTLAGNYSTRKGQGLAAGSDSQFRVLMELETQF